MSMDPAYVARRLSACREHLTVRSLVYDKPVLQGEDPDDEAVFSMRLTGKLEIFDIALLNNGMTALRQIDPDDETRQVIFQQAIPEFIVDIAKDLELGYSCSHL